MCDHHKSPGIVVNKRPDRKSCNAAGTKVSVTGGTLFSYTEMSAEELCHFFLKVFGKTCKNTLKALKIFISRVCRSSEEQLTADFVMVNRT